MLTSRVSKAVRRVRKAQPIPTLREWDIRHSRENWLWKRGMRHEPLDIVPGKTAVVVRRWYRILRGGYPASPANVYAWERPVGCSLCGRALTSTAVKRGEALAHQVCVKARANQESTMWGKVWNARRR